ncbi:MAG: hypothetical protein KKD31_17460 [Bacteroidetes bacterium]|nr:hypothetical protein [Bacteroidota bacterium]
MQKLERFKRIKTVDLELDSWNPRFPKSMRDASATQIIQYMLLEASTIELMQAIGENGFFEGEQLLVVASALGKFKVVEGNRRLTAVMLLNDWTLAPVRKETVKQVFDNAIHKPINDIPCLVFSKEEEIRKYLGYRHITGIKSWGLSEKARYLSELRNSQFGNRNFKDSCIELARSIGSTKSYVTRVLAAFEIYKYIEDEAFFSIKDLDDTSFYVGYYSDGLSRHNIAYFLGVDFAGEDPLSNFNKDNVRLLTKWFYEKFEVDGKIKTRLKGKSSDLNDLNTILGHDGARKAFVEDQYTLERAVNLADDLDVIFQNSIKAAVLNLESADRLTQNIKWFYSGLEEDLILLRKISAKIKNAKEEFERKEYDEYEH